MRHWTNSVFVRTLSCVFIGLSLFRKYVYTGDGELQISDHTASKCTAGPMKLKSGVWYYWKNINTLLVCNNVTTYRTTGLIIMTTVSDLFVLKILFLAKFDIYDFSPAMRSGVKMELSGKAYVVGNLDNVVVLVLVFARKPCCRKETARCRSCSFRFKVRRRHSLQV